MDLRPMTLVSVITRPTPQPTEDESALFHFNRILLAKVGEQCRGPLRMDTVLVANQIAAAWFHEWVNFWDLPLDKPPVFDANGHKQVEIARRQFDVIHAYKRGERPDDVVGCYLDGRKVPESKWWASLKLSAKIDQMRSHTRDMTMYLVDDNGDPYVWPELVGRALWKDGRVVYGGTH